MSDSPLYDLNTAYPFVWSSGTFPETLKNVLDMRLTAVLPSTSAVPELLSCAIHLTHMDSSGGQAELILSDNNGSIFLSSSYAIPVLTEGTTTTSSFIALDHVPESAWSGSIDIHPDCLMLMQEAPVITANITTEYATTSSACIHSGATLKNGDVLSFMDGYNVAISAEELKGGATVTFDCGSENGLGIWTTSPWSHSGGSIPLNTFSITGLRSINGVTGDVRILGDASVRVTTSVSSGAVILAITEREQ